MPVLTRYPASLRMDLSNRPGVISGILLSAVLAASMSTADSQLLAASSAFSSDVYKPVIRKGKAAPKIPHALETSAMIEPALGFDAMMSAAIEIPRTTIRPVHIISLELPLDLQSCSASSGSALTSRVLLQES